MPSQCHDDNRGKLVVVTSIVSSYLEDGLLAHALKLLIITIAFGRSELRGTQILLCLGDRGSIF